MCVRTEVIRALRVQRLKGIYVGYCSLLGDKYSFEWPEKDSSGNFIRWLIASRGICPITDDDPDPVISKEALPDLFEMDLAYMLKSIDKELDIPEIVKEYDKVMTQGILDTLRYTPTVDEIDLKWEYRGPQSRIVASWTNGKLTTIWITDESIRKLLLPGERRLSTMMKDLDFTERAYEVMQRYTNIGLPGLQFAAAKLYKRLGIEFELFASVFNHTAPEYFSLYPDLEEPYGSKGSFYHSDLGVLKNKKKIAANPPFDEYTIEHMVDRLQEIAQSTDARIFVIVPKWEDSIGIQRLREIKIRVQEEDPEYWDAFSGTYKDIRRKTLIFEI